MTDSRYQNSKIYKITDIGYNKCYYGSTIRTLCRRMAGHRETYIRYKQIKNKYILATYDLFDEFGMENCKIELVELYPCNSKEELLKREGHYIKSNPCVNKSVAGRTPKEYYEEVRKTKTFYNI